jgi:integrase
MSGLRKTYGVKQAEAPGLLADTLRTTVSHIPDDLSGRRDRALLVVGFLAGLRRSEIAGLTWGDIDTESERDGVVVTLAKSKTDQEMQGRSIGLHRQADDGLCPFVTLSAWRNALGEIDAKHVEHDAPVFVQVTRWGTVKPGHMTGNTIALVIQKRAMKAGLSVQYQGHSLRKGFVQSAHKAGVSIDAVMATTGHKSVKMLMRYQSQTPVMSQSASKGLLA